VRTSMRGTRLISPLAALLCACGGGDATDQSFTVRDSAGVTIVESLEPAWRQGGGWRLSTEPILEIGVIEGDDPYQFDDIRDVALTPDGHVVVANGGTEEIRVYDPRGRFVQAHGGQGEGPGEFLRLTSVEARSDAILGFDTRQRRLTAFDGAGAVAWSITLEEGSIPADAPAFFGDGSFVLAAVVGDTPSLEDLGVGRIFSRSAAVSRYSPDATPLETLGVFAVEQWASFEHMDGDPAIITYVPFGRGLKYAARGPLAYVADGGDGYQVLVFNREGVLTRIVRRPGLDLRIPQAAVDSFWQAQIDDVEDLARREYYEHLAAFVPYPDQRAPYGDLVVDTEGCLWMSEYHHTRPPASWDVFDAEGHWLGEITVPRGFQVFEVGEDYVLGVASDELDVEYVRMYGLVR
jgi:hypothetical protein